MGDETIRKSGTLSGQGNKTFEFIKGDSLNDDDMKAIQRWGDYFERKGVPFKVVKNKRQVKLIKRKYV